MATCLKPHSEARNSPSRPKFVFPRKKKRRNSNSHVKTEILLRLGLFSINVTPAQTSKHLIERSQNSSPSPIELLFSNSSPISFFQAEPRPTSSAQLWEALQSFHQCTKSQAPPEGLRMAFVPTSANAPNKQGAKTSTETQHAVSCGLKGAIE